MAKVELFNFHNPTGAVLTVLIIIIFVGSALFMAHVCSVGCFEHLRQCSPWFRERSKHWTWRTCYHYFARRSDDTSDDGSDDSEDSDEENDGENDDKENDNNDTPTLPSRSDVTLSFDRGISRGIAGTPAPALRFTPLPYHLYPAATRHVLDATTPRPRGSSRNISCHRTGTARESASSSPAAPNSPTDVEKGRDAGYVRTNPPTYPSRPAPRPPRQMSDAPSPNRVLATGMAQFMDGSHDGAILLKEIRPRATSHRPDTPFPPAPVEPQEPRRVWKNSVRQRQEGSRDTVDVEGRSLEKSILEHSVPLRPADPTTPGRAMLKQYDHTHFNEYD